MTRRGCRSGKSINNKNKPLSLQNTFTKSTTEVSVESTIHLNELFNVITLPQIPEEDGISPKDPEIYVFQEYSLSTFIVRLEQLRHRNRQMNVPRIDILHCMMEMKLTLSQKWLVTDIPNLIRIRSIQTFDFLFDNFTLPYGADIIHHSLSDMIEHMHFCRSLINHYR